MLLLSRLAIACWLFNILLAPPESVAQEKGSSNPAGVLSELTIATFPAGAIQAVATDPSGNVYVTGSTSSFNFPVKNAAQPVIGEARILTSTNLGVSWSKAGLPPTDVTIVVPDPVNPQIIFAEGSTAVFRSSDGGQTWATVYQFPTQYFTTAPLVVDPGNHLRIATVVNSYLVRSIDGGNTWTNGASIEVGPLVVDPTGSGALIASSPSLRISRDWGATFQEIETGIPGTPSVAAFDPSNPGWIYADTTGGTQGSLSLSKDFGATWTLKASPSDVFSGILQLQVAPGNPNILVAETPDGLFVSSDGANSWTRPSGQGPGSFPVDGFEPFVLVSNKCSPTGGVLAVGAEDQVDFSPDDGTTWGTPKLTSVTNVAIGPNCVAYVTRTAGTDAFVAKLSPDGAVQWATYLGGSEQDVPVALSVDAQGNAYVTGGTYSPDFPTTVPLIGVAGESSVFVTKFTPNGTIAFSAVLSGELENSPRAITVDLSGNIWVAGQTDSASFPVTQGALFSSLGTPGDYTGFLAKLSANGALVYSTYIGPSSTITDAILTDANNEVIVAGSGAAPSLPAPTSGSQPPFIVKLNPSGTEVVSGIYLPNEYGTPNAMAIDAGGNIVLFGIVQGGPFTPTPGAYISPASTASCHAIDETIREGEAFVLKLSASFQTIYGALLNTPCGISPGTIALDSAGAPVFSMSTGLGLALRSPFLAGPTCDYQSNAIAKLSPDGSSLQFATYLPGCGTPAIVVGPNGSVYAGTASSVLNFNTNNPPFSVDQVSNAFSGDPSAVTAGGLYSLTGSGFPSVASMNLGLNPARNLPTELEGIKVLFDGEPAQLLEVSPSRIIVASPERLIHTVRGAALPKFTSIRISYGGSLSSPVWMPVAPSLPGLLTTDLLNVAPHANGPDGYVQNQDGTLNSPTNPAAIGSTITLFVTGMGATATSVFAGDIAQSTAVTPDASVYATWRTFSFEGPNPPETVLSIPGFVSSMFQIPLQIPSTEASGRVTVGLQLEIDFDDIVPPASNVIGVYVK